MQTYRKTKERFFFPETGKAEGEPADVAEENKTEDASGEKANGGIFVVGTDDETGKKRLRTGWKIRRTFLRSSPTKAFLAANFC